MGANKLQSIFQKLPARRSADNEHIKGSGQLVNLLRSEQFMPAYGDQGNASRYFYCAKTSKDERNFGITCCAKMMGQYSSDGAYEKVWVTNAMICVSEHSPYS